jgi:hypothetical protein
VLRLAAELLVDAVPGIGFAADAATLIDMANTIAELRKLKIDADAAIEFVKHGPYSLEELQVSSNYEEFSSYGDFIKDAAYIALLVKRFGGAAAAISIITSSRKAARTKIKSRRRGCKTPTMSSRSRPCCMRPSMGIIPADGKIQR